MSISRVQVAAPKTQLPITTNQSTITANWSRPGKPQMSLAVPAKPLKSSPQKPPLPPNSATPIPGNHVKMGRIFSRNSTKSVGSAEQK